MKKRILYFSFLVLITLSFMSGYLYSLSTHSKATSFEDKKLEAQRVEFLSHRNDMVHQMIHEGKYACCLEKPCTYCIEKTPGHGEGASCHCLEDVVTGKHPCGECIGEILESHGNRFLAPYFSQAIAEEVGEQHLDALNQIISEKYELQSPPES